MRYIVDNDLHIHTKYSPCSNDENQTPKRILQYAKQFGLKTVCATDHFWQEEIDGAPGWYQIQNLKHISQVKPLPQSKGIRFLFGCEAELGRGNNLAVSKRTYENFDFVIIPTTHFQLPSCLYDEERVSIETRAKAWLERFEYVLNQDLEFEKTGIAHLTTEGLAKTREDVLAVVNSLPEKELFTLFSKAASCGVGIELNSYDMRFTDNEADIILRPYRIAKKCGCKFYLGSDAHHPDALDSAKEIFERAIDFLELEETDKFKI